MRYDTVNTRLATPMVRREGCGRRTGKRLDPCGSSSTSSCMTPDSLRTPSSDTARSRPASPAFAAVLGWAIGLPGSDQHRMANRASSCSPCGLQRRCASMSTGTTLDSSGNDRTDAGVRSSAAATTSITGTPEPATGSKRTATTVTPMERRTGTTSGMTRARPGSWLHVSSPTSVRQRSTFRTDSDLGKVATISGAFAATDATSRLTCRTTSSGGSKIGPPRLPAWPAIRSIGRALRPAAQQLLLTSRQLDDVDKWSLRSSRATTECPGVGRRSVRACRNRRRPRRTAGG